MPALDKVHYQSRATTGGCPYLLKIIMNNVILDKKSASAPDIAEIRQQFPILHQHVHGHPLVYLDNSNTTQKPTAVLAAMDRYYSSDNANIHRSVYQLSERATKLYEDTRDSVQAFINARHRHEIVFTKGTTEGINLIAHGLSHCHLKPGDEIIISGMEHHSNIVPWQLACETVGATLRIIPVLDNGELDIDAYHQLFNHRTRLVALVHVSNVLGVINPVQHMIEAARANNIPVLLDGAQAISHIPVDVQALDCDFYLFSAHKMYGPTGVGVLYAKEKWLHAMPPYQGGGSMIRQVTFAKTTYADVPYKFEAGTPNIAGVIGLGAAITYLNQHTLARITHYEAQLTTYALKQLSTIPGLRLIGSTTQRAAVISFVIDGIHPHDIGTALDTYGIAVRVGHHCAMPLMERFNVPATVRISFGIYNTQREVDALVNALLKIIRLFNV